VTFFYSYARVHLYLGAIAPKTDLLYLGFKYQGKGKEATPSVHKCKTGSVFQHRLKKAILYKYTPVMDMFEIQITSPSD
jgi:hypothetical protein